MTSLGIGQETGWGGGLVVVWICGGFDGGGGGAGRARAIWEGVVVGTQAGMVRV